MPTGEKSYNSFVKGLVTEANPLTYPENASLDEDNFVLERNGKRSRRLGVDYESGYTLNSSGFTAATVEGTKISHHRWDAPGGASDVSIGIVRISEKLWFINLLTTSPSSNLLNGGSALTISGLQNAEIEVAIINNAALIVSSDLSKPVLLTYNATTDVVSQEEITINVRDVWGVNDSLAQDSRPTVLSALHKYNLRNQGWNTKIVSTCGTDAIDCTYTTITAYPSNADQWSFGKIGDATSANFEKYDPSVLKRNSIDNAEAARGSYILNAFMRGSSRETASGLTGLPADVEAGHISSVATYSGRVFYSGVISSITGADSLSPNYSGYVFFSQTVTANDKLGKCYQEADPTSPEISDIVDTDGGTIQIPEATRIIKIVNAKQSLIVFAENGVWEIFGDTGGFKATSYQLNKVSAVGISNGKSVVESNGLLYYFAKSGIYVLAQDNVSGRYNAENLSLTTIQTLYNDLSEVTKNNARGFYDEKENRIRWLYNDDVSYSDTSFVNKFNNELILDLTLQAFYKHSISDLVSGSPYVCDYIDIPGYVSTTSQTDVYVGSDQVLSSTDTVYIEETSFTARTSQFSFLTVQGVYFTVSKYSNSSFKDWVAVDGVGTTYSSYLVTGYEMFGDLSRNKYVPYIFFYFERTEDGFTADGDNLILDNQSSCLVQAQWNWTNSANSGKWGTQFQAYRFNRLYTPSGAGDTFDYGEIVIVSKNRLRGTGRCLSLKIQSETGKDMKLLGWMIRGNAKTVS